MNFARSAGSLPAGRASLDRSAGRAAFFAGAGVLAALNAQADQILSALHYLPLPAALTMLGGISAVIWFALYAALKIGFEGDERRLDGKDVAVLCTVALMCFFPMSHAGRAGLLLAGAYLFGTSQTNTSSRRVAMILLALTGPLLWGPILLNLFAGPVLALDARIVGLVIGTHVDGNVVRFAGVSKDFLIAGPCSSVHNISLALVLWTTAAALFAVRIDRRFVLFGLAMAAWMFMLNIARLGAIGLWPDRFHDLHGGTGAALFGWAGLLGAAWLAGFGILDATRRKH